MKDQKKEITEDFATGQTKIVQKKDKLNEQIKFTQKKKQIKITQKKKKDKDE